MNIYRLSWFDMYGAHRAGKSYAHIARVAGCSPGVVRYRVKRFSWSEREWREHVTLSRLVRQKGHRIVEGSWQMHDYVFHRDGEKYCDRCRMSRTPFGRALKAMTAGALRGLATGGLGGALPAFGSVKPGAGLFERPRRVVSRAEIDAMDWPDVLDG